MSKYLVVSWLITASGLVRRDQSTRRSGTEITEGVCTDLRGVAASQTQNPDSGTESYQSDSGDQTCFWQVLGLQ